MKRKRIEEGEVLAEAINAIRRTQQLLKESDKILRWSLALSTESKQGRKAPQEFDEFNGEDASEEKVEHSIASAA